MSTESLIQKILEKKGDETTSYNRGVNCGLDAACNIIRQHPPAQTSEVSDKKIEGAIVHNCTLIGCYIKDGEIHGSLIEGSAVDMIISPELLIHSLQPFFRTSEPVKVSLEECAAESHKACSNFYTTWDGKDALAVHNHVAKAVIESLKQQGVRVEYDN